MTPEKAVDIIVRTGVTRNDRSELRCLFEAVATTAKENETLRCVKVLRGMTTGETGMDFIPITANKILRTGGLKVEE